jgi:hypothetical protein
MRRLLARLLGSTSDPALVEAVARLAGAQRDTNELLGEAFGVLREVDAGLGRVTCWQPVQAEELRGLLDRQHVDIVTLNALLGRIEKALTTIASPPPAAGLARDTTPTADTGPDHQDEASASCPAPSGESSEGRIARLNNPDRVEGHGGDSLAAADAPQPGPVAAPVAPAAIDPDDDEEEPGPSPALLRGIELHRELTSPSPREVEGAILADPAAHWSDPVALADELPAEQRPEEGASSASSPSGGSLPVGTPAAAVIAPPPALSPREKVLDFIRRAAEAGAPTPRREEIAAATGTTKTYAGWLIDKLVADGAFRREGRTAAVRFVFPSGAATLARNKAQGQLWTPDHEQRLRELHAAGRSDADMAATLGRSEEEIRGHCGRLGLAVNNAPAGKAPVAGDDLTTTGGDHAVTEVKTRIDRAAPHHGNGTAPPTPEAPSPDAPSPDGRSVGERLAALPPRCRAVYDLLRAVAEKDAATPTVVAIAKQLNLANIAQVSAATEKLERARLMFRDVENAERIYTFPDGKRTRPRLVETPEQFLARGGQVTRGEPKFLAPSDHAAVRGAEAAERLKNIKLPEPADGSRPQQHGAKKSQPLPPDEAAA